jgi:GTP-binding protein
MIVKSATFVESNTDWSKCPAPNIPEYAFIGRSNVGKSSLINLLTNHKKLAKTSSTPGKTQLINHFLINESWYLVDLPGYGYAKVSKKEREKFGKLITNYITKRKNLVNVFLLIDSRHEPQKSDLEFMKFLGKNAIPFTIVMTKIDKLNSAKLGKNLTKYKSELLKTWEALPPIYTTSATSKIGAENILSDISHYNKQLSDRF